MEKFNWLKTTSVFGENYKCVNQIATSKLNNIRCRQNSMVSSVLHLELVVVNVLLDDVSSDKWSRQISVSFLSISELRHCWHFISTSSKDICLINEYDRTNGLNYLSFVFYYIFF